MWYVYTLSFDGTICYVGVSMQPAQRYKEHYSDSLSKCFRLIRYLAWKNKIVQMNVIHGYPVKMKAFRMERYYIEAYSKLYYLLNNDTWFNGVSYEIPRVSKIYNKQLLMDEVGRIKNQLETIRTISLNNY